MGRAELQDFIRDRRDRHHEQKARDEIDDEIRARHEGEEDDRDDDDEKEECGAAARVRGRIGLDALGGKRVAVLEGVNGHVLRAVIREHAADLRHERDQREIAEEEQQTDRAFRQVQQQRRRDGGVHELGDDVGDTDEDREGAEEPEPHGDSVRGARRCAALFVELDFRGTHEHAHAVRDALPEHDQAANERRARDARALQ